MRNIFLFIRRFFNFFLFLVLQGTAIAILVKYNKTHQAIFAGIANEATGWVSTKYNNIDYYFHLGETNKALAAENARLRNMLPSSFDNPDSTHISKADTSFRDTLGRIRKFNFLPAKVVNNSVSEENNYLTLYRGSKQGVNDTMSVIGPDGIVGKVVFVSDNYCRVMSLLNRNSKVSAMLKKDFYTGDVEWDGKDPGYLVLRKISKSAKVAKGDTVLTSNYSTFPPGLMIGTIAEINVDAASGFYILKIKTATNFYTLQYAYLVQDMLWEEQRRLELQTPKIP